MQKPATVPIDLMQGATFRLGLVYKNRLKKPYDLTGYRAHMQIREASGSLVHDLSTENGGINLNAVPGGIDLYIADEATAEMTFTAALYDLFIEAPNGDRIPVVAGKVTLVKGQTKAQAIDV
jgi:hypothetical protein